MYRLMRDGNVSPRLRGVPSQLVRDGGSAKGRKFWVPHGLRDLFPFGTRLRLAPPPRALARMGDRPPRSAFDSQLTIEACEEQS